MKKHQDLLLIFVFLYDVPLTSSSCKVIFPFFTETEEYDIFQSKQIHHID